uniref:SCP domain-containing protein n=1 Tax=Varanus komodoensis TaxID=61221 RepID=A0A8D2KUX9_VARKO
MGNTWFKDTASEKDLEIVVDHKLNINHQCDVTAKKNKSIWHIQKHFLPISDFACGESLAQIKIAMSWSKVIATWISTKTYFKYGIGPTDPKKNIYTYTQIIWYKSYLVGCALSYCRKYAIPFFYVCQYCPVGNIQGKINTPYKEGPSCGDCPNNCENNLCSNSCYQSSLCHFLRTAAPGRFHLSGAATKTLSGTSAK